MDPLDPQDLLGMMDQMGELENQEIKAPLDPKAL